MCCIGEKLPNKALQSHSPQIGVQGSQVLGSENFSPLGTPRPVCVAPHMRLQAHSSGRVLQERCCSPLSAFSFPHCRCRALKCHIGGGGEHPPMGHIKAGSRNPRLVWRKSLIWGKGGEHHPLLPSLPDWSWWGHWCSRAKPPPAPSHQGL